MIKKLLEVLNYDFVQEYYNHTMTAAATYSEQIQQGYLVNGKEATFVSEIRIHLQTLDTVRVRNYLDLVQKVSSKPKCEAFLEETKVSFDALIQVLGYLLRWVLPFRIPIKELVDTIAETDMTAYYATLGKSFSDFKTVIPLDWMIGGARILPKVVAE